jgi:Leucine-rich repeat (LRR) protein
VSELKSLVRLDLSGNQLKEFPPGLPASTSLTFLNLANNHIRYNGAMNLR